MTTTKTSYKTCPLCEATCGLEIVTRDREVISIKGDADDVFSHGYICPKAYSLKELDADPDRIRTPMVRKVNSGNRLVGTRLLLKSSVDSLLFCKNMGATPLRFMLVIPMSIILQAHSIFLL